MHTRLILIGLFVVLTACTGHRSLPEDNYYALPKLIDVTEGKQLFNMISVMDFQADDIYKERAIVYTEDDITFKLYHYHHWIDSPSRLLTERLAERLRLDHFARYVLTTYEGDSELIIKGRIKSFERIRLDNKDSVRVRLVLQVNSSSKYLPVLLDEYSETVTADGNTITDTVTAFARAVDLIFSRFQKELRENLSEN